MHKTKLYTKYLWKIFALTSVFGACSSSDDASSKPGHYVVNSITLTATATADVDGDGSPENKLGGLITNLAQVGGLDIQSAVTSDINRGATVTLATVEADAYNNDDSINVSIYNGENSDPSPCAGPEDNECGKHLSGSASFDVKSNSSTVAPLTGSVTNSAMAVGQGEVTMQVTFSPTSAPLTLNLKNASIEGTLTSSTINDGVIAGAVTDTDMQSDVLPAIVETLNEAVVLDCTLDPAAGNGCCTDTDSRGADILGLFDGDADCAITLTEFQSNALVQQLLTPDLDLDADANADAYSIGLEFTAVGARFTKP